MAGRRPLCRRAGESGFLLPLSIGTSMLLVLGSLSLQMAVLQGRMLLAAQRDRQLSVDALQSAAHRLAGALQGSHRCLRALPSSSWSILPLPVDCPAGLDPAVLQRMELAGASVLLHSWEPDAEGGSLRLQLQGGRHSARFVLRFSPGAALQEVG